MKKIAKVHSRGKKSGGFYIYHPTRFIYTNNLWRADIKIIYPNMYHFMHEVKLNYKLLAKNKWVYKNAKIFLLALGLINSDIWLEEHLYGFGIIEEKFSYSHFEQNLRTITSFSYVDLFSNVSIKIFINVMTEKQKV